MGLLESVIGALATQGRGPAAGDAGGAGAAGAGDLLNAVIGMLGDDGAQGGLGGLVEKFQRGGMGDVIGSWISSGQNIPISPDQLKDVLGSDTLGQLARQLGLGQDELNGQLSQVLPQVVDRMTPNGQAPEGGLGNIADILGAFDRR